MSFTISLDENPELQTGAHNDVRAPKIRINDPIGDHLRLAKLEEETRRTLRQLNPIYVTEEELFQSYSRRVVIENYVCQVAHGVIPSSVPPPGQSLSKQISDLSDQMTRMNDHLSNQLTQMHDTLSNQLTQMHETLSNRPTRMNEDLSNQLTRMNDNLSIQLTRMNDELSHQMKDNDDKLAKLAAVRQEHGRKLELPAAIQLNNHGRLDNPKIGSGIHDSRFNDLTRSLADYHERLEAASKEHALQMKKWNTRVLVSDGNCRARQNNAWQPLLRATVGGGTPRALPNGHGTTTPKLGFRDKVYDLTMEQINELENQHN